MVTAIHNSDFPKRRNLDWSWDCSDVVVPAKLEQDARFLRNEQARWGFRACPSLPRAGVLGSFFGSIAAWVNWDFVKSVWWYEALPPQPYSLPSSFHRCQICTMVLEPIVETFKNSLLFFSPCLTLFSMLPVVLKSVGSNAQHCPFCASVSSARYPSALFPYRMLFVNLVFWIIIVGT